MKNKNFCIQPFVGLNTQPNGDVKMCCRNHHVTGNTNIDTLEDIWNHDVYKNARKVFLFSEDRVSSCKECWSVEDSGGQSYRQIMNVKYREHFDVVDTVDTTGSMPYSPKYAELILSSHCNFACAMCFPAVSTSVSKKWTPIMQEVTGIPSVKGPVTSYKSLEAALVDAKKLSNSVVHLSISGGEPFMHPDFPQILEEFEWRKHEISLMVQTNMSKLNAGKIDLLRKLRGWEKLYIVLSIDGDANMHEYIRNGADSNLIIENVKKLRREIPEAVLIVNTTTNALNIANLPETLEFILNDIQADWVSTGFVSNFYLKSSILPDEMKLKIGYRLDEWIEALDGSTEKMQRIFSFYDGKEPDCEIETLYDRIQSIVRIAKASLWLEVNSNDVQSFKRFVKELDSSQQKNISLLNNEVGDFVYDKTIM